jgi:hypothetical protein
MKNEIHLKDKKFEKKMVKVLEDFLAEAKNVFFDAKVLERRTFPETTKDYE